MIDTLCGACGGKIIFTWTFTAGGLKIAVDPPFRIRNASCAVAEDGRKLPGAAVVLLCSDICEERYRDEVGFANEIGDL